jgi:DegV family protein with EDD domain
MEHSIRIVTDSSCDLPQQVVERLQITVVPLIVRFGPEEYADGDLSVDEFWEKASRVHPHTSQPPVGKFEEVFERLVAQGKQVLCLTVTGKHSGTFNAAHLAAQRFGEMVNVFDSLSLSLGAGLQALAAAEAAQAGRTAQEIMAMLENLRARMRVTILLDTLENLRRGGRADGFIAIVERMTRALNVKPLINLVDGQLRLLGMARSFQGGQRRLAEIVERLGPLEHLGVVHTRILQTAREMADRLAERIGFPQERIWVQETGPVLACHAGPRVLGVVALPTRPAD